jgi:hypothetical protein
LATGNGGARNKYEDLEVFKAAELVAGTSYPVLTLGRR